MRKILLSAIVAVILAVGVVSCAPEPHPIPTWLDWPMFHHDEQRTGKAEAHGIITNSTTLRWSYSAGAAFAVTSSPVVDEWGTIYFGSCDGKLYALNASDGALKFSTLLTSSDGWDVRIDSSPGLSGSWSLYPGRIYIGTVEEVWNNGTGDNFFAVNGTTGGVIWSRQVPDGNPSPIKGYSSPLVVTDPINGEPVIYVGAENGVLYCIRDRDDHGEVVWNTTLQWPDEWWGFHSSVAMGLAPVGQFGLLKTIYCGGQETGNGRGKLFALDPYSGAIIDSIVLTTNGGQWVSSPSVTIIDGVETIFAGTCDPTQKTGQMCAVKKVGTALQLAAPNYQVANLTVACPAIYDLNGDGKVEVIFGDMGGTVYAVTYDPGAGWSTYWTYVTGSVEIGAGAAVALAPQPTVFVGGSSYFPFGPPGGTIYSIKWDGTLLGSYNTTPTEQFVTTAPAIAQESTELYGAPGWVFVGSWDSLTNLGNGKLYAFGPPP